MAAALFAGAASGGGRAGVNLLSTFASMASWPPHRALPWLRPRDNTGDGHGTHVAATAGGRDYGVATGANIYAMKVLSNSGGGSESRIIAAMDAVADVVKRKRVNPLDIEPERESHLLNPPPGSTDPERFATVSIGIRAKRPVRH